ncbi:TPA_asm: hypothetical protein GZX72_14245 [Listeria monocytogenes]|nr:hypothetical protein [Listeria monocytogenes]
MRSDLKQYQNKTMTVSARVGKVFYRNKLEVNATYRPNVRVLLRDVEIGGLKYDHIWIYVRNKYYQKYLNLKGRRVKFKGTVVSYVKEKEGIFVEDYGIRPKSAIMPAKQFEQTHDKGSYKEC